MRTAPGYKCNGNGCNAERTETNHWLIAFTGSNIVGIKGFIVYPWDDDLAESDEAIHLCGDTCALKLFSDWLSKIRKAPSAELSDTCTEPSLGRPRVETKGLPV